MGISILVGSFIGGYGSNHLSEGTINFIYGILSTIAAIMMFVPINEAAQNESGDVEFNKWLASSLAFIVGLGAGIVGAAGAFILVPIMLVILKIPMRMTIATSLGITFISSIGSTIGKVATGQVLYGPAAIMISASIIASPLGAKLGQKVNAKFLQVIFAMLILATAIKIWIVF